MDISRAECKDCPCKEPLQMNRAHVPTNVGVLDLSNVVTSSIAAQNGVFVLGVVGALLNGRPTTCKTFEFVCGKFRREQ